ncbi:MAG: crosslink repair DNA glycosylase YcaQ family protein [Chloroflexota bacterium]
MPKSALPSPSLEISKKEARRFLLAHQRLWPPRFLHGKQGTMEFIQHVNCVQYDPINVVGRNPDLVLQARVTDYTPLMLEELLYTDRTLLDGWDKVSSIFPVEDWRFFARHRALMVEQHGHPDNPAMQIAPRVKEAIRTRGPLSSIELHGDDKVDWFWAPTRVVRASMETLYAMGELGVHHRVGTRRYFDLIERLLPEEVLTAPDPNISLEDYRDWHVLRRVGSLGLAQVTTGEHWLGILHTKTAERYGSLRRLVDRGDLMAVGVEDQPQTYFMRCVDVPTLQAAQTKEPPPSRAAFIAPLDNLLWDRKLLKEIFGFEYAWEVYKPKEKRKYGYYVLPVLYGDRFIARFDPTFDKESKELVVQNWWWEKGVKPEDATLRAVKDALGEFARYLQADGIQMGEEIKKDAHLGRTLQHSSKTR